MNRKYISILLNILIVFFEVIALFYNLFINHRLYLQYYTELTNIIGLIVSGIYVYYLINNKKISKKFSVVKYTSTVCFAITFLVVFLILTPMSNYNLKAMFIDGVLLFHHLLCPIISIVSFIFFDEIVGLSKKDTIYSLFLTCIYGIIMICLNIFNFVIGPYPFLKVKNQSILVSLVWLILIFSISYCVAFFLRFFKSKRVGK